MSNIKDQLLQLHPEAETQVLGKFTFITEKLEGEDHAQIIYTFNNESNKMKICIGSYVVVLELDKVTLDALPNLLFHHGTYAGLTPRYLRRFTGRY